MAAYNQDRFRHPSILVGGSFNANLPSGSCNYRDLSYGTRAPVCGCKRFWLNPAQVVVGGDERAWCFCGHHACFHSTFNQSQQQALLGAAERPIDTLETYMDTSAPGQRPTVTHLAPEASARQPAGLGIRPDSRHTSAQSINTRVWDALNGFAREQEEGPMSDTTSKLPSTATPSLIGMDGRLSPSRAAPTTRQHTQPTQPMAPPVSIPSGLATRPGAEDYQGSATEVATPSMAGTPDMRALAIPGMQARVNPPQGRTTWVEPTHRELQQQQRQQQTRSAKQQQPLPSSDTAVAARSAPDIQEFIRNYGQRIQVLESLSFSHVPMDEIQERFDIVDGRLLDLEHWRTDQDTLRTSADESEALVSRRQKRLLPSETSSFNSDGSFDENAAAHADAAVLAAIAADAETGPRIHALESRVANLESAAMPSYSHPWQVEVVLLPWSRELRGVWVPSTERIQQFVRSSASGPEEWTGLSKAASSSFQSSQSGVWTTESIQAWAEEAHDWLSPKACGPHGTIYQRLASRGLVRNVTLSAPDPAHILEVIGNTFRNIHCGAPCVHNAQPNNFQALFEPFVPLRKIRKSSRLRFLSPAEMVTSSVWTASFLDSSVFMKVQDRSRRFYITTADAYLQNARGDWTWSRIKQLPSYNADDEQLPGDLVATGAIEACWTHNERLDCPPSLHTSFATHISHDSEWSMRSQQSLDPVNVGSGVERPKPQSSEDGRRYRMHERTMSLPLSSSSRPEQIRAELPKRRVASFETVPTAPVSAADSDAVLLTSKRRRISTSPEADRKGVYFTPRWSREPPSPFTSEPTGELRSQAASSGRRRGTTPFNYATPHSNNFAGTIDLVGGDGDTVHDSELEDDIQSEQNTDEWHGVDGSVMDEQDDD